MDFSIKPDIYLRLASAALQPNESHQKYDPIIRGVRIEYRDGVAFATATNAMIMVVERLDDCGENGEITITTDPRMIELAEAERAVSGKIIITQAPGWTIARGLEIGKMFPLNAEIPGEYPDWRGVIPTVLPSKNTGAFYLDSERLRRIAAASPSGIIVFPKFADKDAPILLRDKHEQDWCAVIFLDDAGRLEPLKYAEIPDWIR